MYQQVTNGRRQTEVDRPLLSVVLCAYNQGKYIADAVKGVLDQTYSPLEIIISDDCSPDDTFTIIEKMAAMYQGPHTLIINRNEKNLGISEHFGRLIDLARGELIIGAAGDDISLPDRVKLVHKTWLSSGKRASSIFSNVMIIDSNGAESSLWFPMAPQLSRTLEEFKRTRVCWALGCSHSFSKNLFSAYGRMHPRLLQEDGAIAFRALLEGGIAYIDEVTVKYRRHEGNVFAPHDASKRVSLEKCEIYMKLTWLMDAMRSNVKDSCLLRILFVECVKTQCKRFLFSIPLLGVSYFRIRTRLGRLVHRSQRS